MPSNTTRFLFRLSSLRQAQAAFTCSNPPLLSSSSSPHLLIATRPRQQFFKHRTLATMATDASFDNLAKQFKHLPLVDKYPNCFPDINPVDVYRSHITSILHDITGADPSVIYPALQWTATLDKGDLTLAIPALRIKGKPDDLGKQWLDKWPESPLVEKPIQNGPFLPFFFKAGPLLKTVIPMALTQKDEFGKNKSVGLVDQNDVSKGKKKIVIEFSSPNIAKPFHAGHLRSTIIGGFLANLYRAVGWDVKTVNYLGDWGKQYGVLALGFEKYGNEEDLVKDPINHLFTVYVKISKDVANEKEAAEKLKAEGKEEEAQKLLDSGVDEKARSYFKKMVDGDPEAIALWKRFRDYSIERYKKTYARLNIHFDEYSGESKVSEEAMQQAADKLKSLGVAHEDRGALLVDFTQAVPGKEGKQLGKAIIRKRDGTALYLTRDISELLNRNERHNFDKMIYVIASEQDLHVKQFFKIVGLMGHKDIADKCQHINFGLVLGMSTRKGTVKFLDDILRDVGDHMHETMKKNEDKYTQVEDPESVADILGISSVMVQDMSGKRINNYTFDLSRMTSFEGDTGPYLQYAHARLCSITRKAGLTSEEIASADLSLLTEPMAINLLRVISQWPDVVQNVLKTLEPTTILTYLFKMTHTLSTSYNHLRIVGSDPEVMKARMALYASAQIVLHNGMALLGLTPVERM